MDLIFNGIDVFLMSYEYIQVFVTISLSRHFSFPVVTTLGIIFVVYVHIHIQELTVLALSFL